MALELPKTRLNVRPIQTQKRNIPLDQIIAVQGQNPLATGIETAGNVIGQALTKRAQLRMQGEQTAQLAAMLGDKNAPQVDPATYLNFVKARATAEKDSTGRAIQLQTLKNDGKSSSSKPMTMIWQDPSTGQVSGQAKQGWVPRQIPETNAATLLATSYNQETNRNRPTSSTRSSAEFARTIIPHIDNMRELIQEADDKGYIGPAAGRLYGEFLAGRIGSTGDPEADRLLGRLRTTDSLLKTGAMRVHFGAKGGQQMYDHFSDMLNTGKQSASMLGGSLDQIESFMQGYADAGSLTPKPLPKPSPSAFPKQSTKDAIRQKLGL